MQPDDRDGTTRLPSAGNLPCLHGMAFSSGKPAVLELPAALPLPCVGGGDDVAEFKEADYRVVAGVRARSQPVVS